MSRIDKQCAKNLEVLIRREPRRGPFRALMLTECSEAKADTASINSIEVCPHKNSKIRDKNPANCSSLKLFNNLISVKRASSGAPVELGKYAMSLRSQPIERHITWSDTHPLWNERTSLAASCAVPATKKNEKKGRGRIHTPGYKIFFTGRADTMAESGGMFRAFQTHLWWVAATNRGFSTPSPPFRRASHCHSGLLLFHL